MFSITITSILNLNVIDLIYYINKDIKIYVIEPDTDLFSPHRLLS